jgi:hypothetical protein
MPPPYPNAQWINCNCGRGADPDRTSHWSIRCGNSRCFLKTALKAQRRHWLTHALTFVVAYVRPWLTRALIFLADTLESLLVKLDRLIDRNFGRGLAGGLAKMFFVILCGLVLLSLLVFVASLVS